MIRNAISLALVAILPFFSLVSASSPPPQVQGHLWVIAQDAAEGHAQACARAGAAPTPASEYIRWNSSVMSEVVSALGRSVDATESPSGLRGCCAAGLWCLDGENQPCFTQAFGTFDNHGALILPPTTTVVPVYTCLPAASPSSASISPSSVTFDAGVLRLQGTALTGNAADAVISVNGSTCYNTERTSEICKPCESSTTGECGIDGVCLSAGRGSFCYKYCAFEGDASCPSGSFCDTVQISSGGKVITTYVCTVRSMDPGSSGCSSTDSPAGTDVYKCDAPEVYHQTSSGTISAYQSLWSLTISVNSDGQAAVAQVTLPSSSFMGACERDSDCFDNNPCTVDSCNSTSKTCIHDYLSGCESSLFRTREVRYPFTYDVFVREGVAAQQDEFKANVTTLGTRSSSSLIDDYAPETVALNMDFKFFGSLFSDISLNPNGMVAFPPFPECQGYAGSIYCISYSSFTNAISAWRSDWNPSESKESGVYYLRQNVSSPAVYGISDVNAFHVLYKDVSKFDQERAYVEPNTFGLSLYEDGSIRVSYVTMGDEVKSTDTFGLWGSKASSSAEDRANLRYRSEIIDASYIKEDEDLVYCTRAVLACPVRGCVEVEGTLQIRWRGSTRCDALNATVSFKCEWAGGIAITEAVVKGLGDDQVLECAVPFVNVSDGVLMTVAISSQYVTANGKQLQDVTLINDKYVGKKSFYAVTENPFDSNGTSLGELVKHEVAVRYYSKGSPLAPVGDQCGCNPFITSSTTYSSAGSFCDSCLVCRYGVNETSIASLELRGDTVDCNGDCFGLAYIDGCNNCSSGLTTTVPKTCGPDGIIPDVTEDNLGDSYGTQIFFVIIIVFCMSCVFSVFLYFARGLFAQRGMPDNIEFILIDGVPIQIVRRSPQEGGQQQNRNGLSEFERDALGEFSYKADKPMVMVEGAALESGGVLPQDSAMSPNECSICLVSFKDGDVCRRLPEPCGHCFHKECVDHWFQLSTSCPLCKRSIKTILFGEDAAGANGGGSMQPTVISPTQQDWMIQYLMDRRDIQNFGMTASPRIHITPSGETVIVAGNSDYDPSGSRPPRNATSATASSDRSSAYAVGSGMNGVQSSSMVEMSTRYDSSDDEMI